MAPADRLTSPCSVTWDDDPAIGALMSRPLGTKVCRECGMRKPYRSFSAIMQNDPNPSNYAPTCRACDAKHERAAWRADWSPEARKKRYDKSQWGLHRQAQSFPEILWQAWRKIFG